MSESDQAYHKVRPLYDAYAHCLDIEDYAKWPSFFEEKCYYQITSYNEHKKSMPIGLIQCTSRGMLVDRVNSMGKANIFEPQRYRFLLGALHIEPTGGGAIRSQMGFAVVRIMESGDSSLFLSGISHDEIVDSEDGLRFSRRVVVLDSSRVDTLLVIPL